MSDKTIKIARYRTTPYITNFTTNNGSTKTYVWAGSIKDKVDIKDIPVEFVDWLVMNSRCFIEGELVIVDESQEAQEILENSIEDITEIKNNSHSKDEIKKILNGKLTNMKEELSKITILEEKRFVLDVAKEIKLDSKTKLDFLSEWMGIPVDILFSVE